MTCRIYAPKEINGIIYILLIFLENEKVRQIYLHTSQLNAQAV